MKRVEYTRILTIQNCRACGGTHKNARVQWLQGYEGWIHVCENSDKGHPVYVRMGPRGRAQERARARIRTLHEAYRLRRLLNELKADEHVLRRELDELTGRHTNGDDGQDAWDKAERHTRTLRPEEFQMWDYLKARIKRVRGQLAQCYSIVGDVEDMNALLAFSPPE